MSFEIIPMKNHYAVTYEGRLIGTIEADSPTCWPDCWSWYPLRGAAVEHQSLHKAIQDAMEADFR